jgi:hypothetical protein
MPLLKYFGFVGGALLLLLYAFNCFLPEVRMESVYAESERPTIRISSMEKLPEKIDFDTNLPTAVPLPTAAAINPPVLQSAFVFVKITPGPLPSFSSATSVVKMAEPVITPRVAKQIGRRAAKPYGNAASDRPVPAASAIQLSLIDDMRSRFGRTVFKLN